MNWHKQKEFMQKKVNKTKLYEPIHLKDSVSMKAHNAVNEF